MSVSFIYNEQLSGVVNGVNKTFTSLNDIDSVESLRLGGVEYTSFSFTGNTVTLADAPTTGLGSPYLDYFVAGVTPSAPVTGKTFGTFISEVYEDIGQDENSPQYPRNMVVRYATETIPIHQNKRVNHFRKVGQYSFNKSKDYNAIAYSATEIDVGTIGTYVPATGAILLRNGSFVEYGSRTSGAFTSLSGLSFVYDADDKVNVGYAIPDGIQKISEVFMDGYELEYVDSREFVTTYDGVYTIVGDYLFLPRTDTDRVVLVHYTHPSVLPIAEDDVIDFQPGYEYVLRYDVLRRMYAQREDTRLAVTNEFYKEALGDYKNYISRQTDNINGTIPASGYRRLTTRNYGYTRRH